MKYFTNGKFMALFFSSAGGQKRGRKNVCDLEKVDSMAYDEMFT